MFVLKLVFPSTSTTNKIVTLDWLYRGETSDMTWDALITKLGEFTKMKKGKFYVSWHDGTEYCTISTTESLREAVKIMRETDTYEVPTLYGFPIFSSDTGKVNAYFGGGLAEDLPKDFRERMKELEEQENSEYFEAAEVTARTLLAECAVCQAKDWPEDKYTCLVCPRLVFCTKCYQTVGHPDHPVLVTRGGATYPGAVLTAVRAVTKNMNEQDSSEESETDDLLPEHCQPQPLPPRSTVSKPITMIEQREPEVAGDPEADAVIATLRQMGFNQDYQQLSATVKAENYDITAVVEKLTSA